MLGPYSEMIDIMKRFGPDYLSDYEANILFTRELDIIIDHLDAASMIVREACEKSEDSKA